MAATMFTNVASAQNIAHGVRVVVVDAGHGGRFPGAHYAGTYEKDLTLAVALRLGKLIETEMPGVKVVYTRTTDKTLGADLAEDLQARANIANRAEGDLFVSIHVNAARSTSARGVETLIMGESPKEQRYNENALFENNREDLIDMSDERMAAIVRAYIQNLQFTYGEYSMAMARCIQNNYVKAGRVSRGVKPQLLRVLYATDMPGVLTEIGFLSNAQEAAYMKSEKGQEEIARSLLKAVKDYSDYVLGTRLPEDGSTIEQPAAVVEESQVAATQPEVKPSDKSETKPEKNSAEQKTPEKTIPAKTPEMEPAKVAKTPAKAVEEPLHYAVQLMASQTDLPLRSSHFKSYAGKVKCYSASGAFRYKYCVGEYDSREKAQKRLSEVRRVFPQAFVVSCRGTQIVK